VDAIAGLAGTIAVAINTAETTKAEAIASNLSLTCWGKVEGASIIRVFRKRIKA